MSNARNLAKVAVDANGDIGTASLDNIDLTTRVAKTGDTMTGDLIVNTSVGIGGVAPVAKLNVYSDTGSAEDLLVFSTAYNSPSGQKAIAWKDTGGTTIAKIGAEYAGGTGAITFGSIFAGSVNSTERMRIDSAGRVLTNGAGVINGANLVVRAGGIAATNASDESSGVITFAARIQSSTNFVIAQATSVNTNTMITAACQYVTIYNWSDSTQHAHGTRHANIRADSSGNTTANNFLDGSYANGGATSPSFYWTGTSTLNLNLTGASSNEGIAYITIAWRSCTMNITPST